MAKSPEAFRTISEVSALLETPAHVLRFWESKFPQVKPVKRAGGRRYYRPDDVQLLGGIKVLLHDRGMTIRGVQKILREEGVRHVAALAPQVWPDDALEGTADEEALDDALDAAPADEEEEAADAGIILGPWVAPAGEERPEAVEAQAEDESLDDLLAEDGLDEVPVAVEAASNGAAEPRRGLPNGADPASHPVNGAGDGTASPLATFIAATLRQVAQGEGAAASLPAGSDPGAVEAAPAEPVAAEPPRAPLPPGPPTAERAVALLRRADPDRLRARADRIAPLLARLRTLQAGLPRPGA